MNESIVRAAARNNATWCATMARVHGVAGELGETTWIASARTPTYYPDAVTLAPGVDADALVAKIDTSAPGASVKDSFADLDLSHVGFEVLFGARWIHRPAGAPSTEPDLAWDVVRTEAALREWALAWDDGAGHADLFRPALLRDDATVVLAGRGAAGDIVAGAVAGRSVDVVGISNLFGSPDSAWPGALSAAYRLFAGLPVVGYEHGDDLDAAVRHGFEPVGPLRIWHRG